ncbi:MAG: restriction endonuclease subunit S, partial [Lactobacillus sp.]|uniref:restriction endonuclease subunit S n=1 Tax=Lactobacillus sp. TaxID=1591 RepID=UPI0023C995E5
MDKKPERLVPEVRFKGFTDDWEQRKLGDIINYIKGYAFKSASYQAKGNVLLVRASDLSSGTLAFLPDKKYLPSQFLETFKRYKLNQGDIVITTVGSKSTMKSSAVGRPIYINSNKPYLLNQNLVKITVNDSINSFYLYTQLLKSKYKYFVSTIERGNANQANITIHDLWKYKAFLTSELEEKQIGHLFLKLNQLFYLQQRKLEQLRQLKIFTLQRMFIDKDCKQPILRFKNFNDNWLPHKFNDIANTFSGGTPAISNKDYYGGNIPFIRSAEINKNTTQLHLTPDGLKNSSAKFIKKGTLLYALYGATSGEVGIAQIDGAINQAVMAINLKKDNVYFIKTWLIKNKRKIISTYLQGGQGNLSAKIVKHLKLSLPKIEEEKLISITIMKIDS